MNTPYPTLAARFSVFAIVISQWCPLAFGEDAPEKAISFGV